MKTILSICAIITLMFACTNDIKNFEEIDFELQLLKGQMMSSADSIRYRIDDDELRLKCTTIQQLTYQTLNQIKKFRMDLIEELGGENFKYSRDIQSQMKFTIEEKNAYILQAQLNSYVDKINALDPSFNFDKIAKDGNEVDEDYEGKDFAHVHFEGTSAVASMALLSQLSLEVAQIGFQANQMMLEKEQNRLFILSK